MSEVAHRAFALVPSESNFEGLTKRLLALRAEIDAILAELASQARAMPRAEGAMAGAGTAVALTLRAEEPAKPDAEEALPVLSDPLADRQSEREGWGMVEEAEDAFEPSAEQPISEPIALPPIQAEQEAPDCAEPAFEDPTPIAAIDTDLADHADDASPFPETEVSPAADTPSATEAVSVEQQDDAAMLDAPQQSVPESIGIEEHRQQPAALVVDGPQAGDSPVTPAAGVGEATAGATVISLHARQRKHKGGLATGAPMPARTGRHLAAKIAACILVLLTAASVLVMADRTALGSVQSLPWISPTPSGPTGIDWLLQRLQSSGDAAAKADLPLDDGPLASHPVAWGA